MPISYQTSDQESDMFMFGPLMKIKQMRLKFNTISTAPLKRDILMRKNKQGMRKLVGLKKLKIFFLGHLQLREALRLH